MKLYRCLSKAEKELFEMNYICSRSGSEEERQVNINTHDYGNVKILSREDKFKSERLHYFLFLEDAQNYFQAHETDFDCIGEYEIPEDLVLENIGCGFYFDMAVPFILEVAIPYVDLIKNMDQDAYDIFVCGTLECDVTTLTRHLSIVCKIREKIENDGLQVPTRIAKCNYCSRIIDSSIELNPNYKNFIENYGILEILESLNVEIIMQDYLFNIFDVSEKQIDLEKLKNILKKYGLLEKEKIYTKIG